MESEENSGRAPVEETMALKKHFLVFCASFLTVALLLGLGAWHTRTEIETRNASEPETPPVESGPAREPPEVQRFANPRPSAAPSSAR